MATKSKPKIEKTTTYKIYYNSPGCYDDGGIGHDQFWREYSKIVEAKTDKEAKLASLDDTEFRAKEHCYHGRHAHPTKIEKTVKEVTSDGFERTTTVTIPLPQAKRCVCGKLYMPIRGQKACHTLTPT